MSVQVLFGCLFLFVRSYTQGIIRISDSSSAHTFWLNKLHGIIIKQQQQRFSLFISVCVCGGSDWCYIWQKISCEWIILQISLLYFCFDFGIRQNEEVNVRTNGIRNRNPSYGYYLCCCCLYGLIIILNPLGYFSSASQAGSRLSAFRWPASVVIALNGKPLGKLTSCTLYPEQSVLSLEQY